MADSLRPPERIGFIGLGNMGAPMARRIAAAGFGLSVTDANAAAVQRLAADTACTPVQSPAQLAATCRAIITMLPDGATVRSVILDGGLAAALPAQSLIIDMSSSAPAGTRELGAELARRGIALVDAPVSGGVRKALDGTLAIMAGGAPEAVARCRELLASMGRVFDTGGPGSGHAMKALNNYLSAATLAVSAEAVIAGTRFGLDPRVMVDILNASTGRSNATEHKYPNFVLTRSFDSGFALGLMAKDLRLALDLARDSGAPHQLLERVAALWSAAEAQLGSRADNTEVVRFLEQADPKPNGS